MSLNLHIKASGIATSPSGKKFRFSDCFNLPQTPTSVTTAVLESSNRIVKYQSFGYGISKLRTWIKKMEDLGFKIEWYGA